MELVRDGYFHLSLMLKCVIQQFKMFVNVDSIQPTSISINTFYKALSFYNIKMNLKPGIRLQTKDEATIIQLTSDLRNSDIIVKATKMYIIIRRNYSNIGVS